MKALINKMNYLLPILSEQSLKEETEYRFLKYIQKLSFEDGLLLYNVLTGELLFLDKQEENLIIPNNEVYNYLVKNWFLVPADFDDLKFIKQVEDTVMGIKRIYTASKIKTFTILPTTDCNARCFYCFELGCKHIYMDEKTAHDVAKYIIKNKADGKILIRWFGGEPLCNTKVIDIICSDLKENNVEFFSTMVSNSYLFDEDLIKHAKEHWNLKMVQVTLDGTEDVYNKIKNYIYKDVSSPFRRVLNNIQSLLEADIVAKIRMNMDKHNSEDLFTLTYELLDRFAEYENFWIYPHTLYENSCDSVKQQTVDDIISLEKKCNQLYDVIKQHNKQKKNTKLVITDRKLSKCMADSDTSILILPGGNLGKCEHHTDDRFIGSIYSDKIDFDILNSFKERVLVWDECLNCELRPMCYHLNECSNRDKLCYDDKKRRKIDGLKEEMLTVYRNYKKGLNNEA